jgi:DNA-directed RNA polymerase specialized sigma24 family protein
MKTHIEIVGLADDERRQLSASAETQARDLAERHPEGERRFSVLLRPARDESFEARLSLRLPKRTLSVTSRDEDAAGALASGFDLMTAELAHVEDHQGRAGRRQTALALREAADDLEEQVKQDDRRAFEHALRPRLDLLRRQARRELLLYELEGRIDRSGIAVDGVVDDVVLRAWEKGLERPADSHLDQWLLEQLHQVIDERMHENRLGFVGGDDDEGISSEAWWPLPDDDAIEDLLGEGNGGEIDEMGRRWRALPKVSRRAAALHLLDGYEVSELGPVFDVPEGDLAAAIEEGRKALASRLEES